MASINLCIRIIKTVVMKYQYFVMFTNINYNMWAFRVNCCSACVITLVMNIIANITLNPNKHNILKIHNNIIVSVSDYN